MAGEVCDFRSGAKLVISLGQTTNFYDPLRHVIFTFNSGSTTFVLLDPCPYFL
jgi:hypothetical protein